MLSVAADAVLLLHAAFVVFAVFGGLLALRWRWTAWLHLPAVAWAAFVELTGRQCPLTPLENTLRRQAGQAAYDGDFIGHHIGSLLYPPGITQPMQTLLGVGVVLINVVVYAAIVRRRLRGSGR